MTLTLTDPASGTSVELYHADDLRSDVQGSAEASPPPGFDSDQPFLSQLTHEGRATITGEVSAMKLSRTAGYSDNPRTALAEWAVRFLAFVNGGQGDGYELTRGYRGDTFQGYVESQEYSVRGGEPFSLGYSLEFVRGKGFGATNAVTIPSASPTESWIVDGTELPTITEASVQKTQSVEVTRRTFAETPEDNDITSNGGAVREINVTGTVEGSEAERNTFDDNLSDTIGQDSLVDFENGLTGEIYTGMVQSYEATDEAGLTRLGDFGLRFVEGTN